MTESRLESAIEHPPRLFADRREIGPIRR